MRTKTLKPSLTGATTAQDAAPGGRTPPATLDAAIRRTGMARPEHEPVLMVPVRDVDSQLPSRRCVAGPSNDAESEPHVARCYLQQVGLRTGCQVNGLTCCSECAESNARATGEQKGAIELRRYP